MSCTGLTAAWCPNCGDCTCEKLPSGEPCLDDGRCALHAPKSPHAETVELGDCEKRVSAMAADCGVELNENDHATVSRFAQYLCERSRKKARGG